MAKLLLKILLYVIVVGLIVASLVFSYKKLSRVACSKVEIIIPDGSPRFIDGDDVAAIIRKIDAGLTTKPVSAINTEQIEQALEKVSCVKNVEVYSHITCTNLEFHGKLVVKVEQRRPVFHVLNGDEDYYVDSTGVKIPLKPKVFEKIPLVTGNLDQQYAAERLLPMINYIRKDKFWSSQVQQVDVDKNNEIEIVPLVGNQLIEFGGPENFEEKFRNLKALYEQGFSKTGWQKYCKISLKYKNQVVCTKR